MTGEKRPDVTLITLLQSRKNSSVNNWNEITGVVNSLHYVKIYEKRIFVSTKNSLINYYKPHFALDTTKHLCLYHSIYM